MLLRKSGLSQTRLTCGPRMISISVVLGAQLLLSFGAPPGQRKNPGPGDPYPDDFVYDTVEGGQFRLSDFRGRKAVLIVNHILDDESTSWHPDPFKRLKELQARYEDRLAIAIMPEYAHNRSQDRALWEAGARDVRDFMNPGNIPVLIESRGSGGKRAGHADHSLYQALNPEGLRSWWPMVLIDKEGRIAWTSKNPQNGNSEHMIYETELRSALVSLVDPAGYREWLSRVPRDWIRQDSPWGSLEIEGFERYRDMGDLHVSTAWTNRPPMTYKGELSNFPTRSGYRALGLFHSQRAGFVFGYPFYYGYRDPGYGIWARHTFAGSPRQGTLLFFFAAFLHAAKLNYSEGKGRGFALQLEGKGDEALSLRFGRVGQHPPPGADDEIAGDVETRVTWNPDNVWNRISFHVDERSGTRIFLDRKLVGETPSLTAITGILFQAGWAVSVDDIVMIPRQMEVEDLDGVVDWVDTHALERPHATPLERERIVEGQAASKKQYPTILRVNWGASQSYTDPAGALWLPDQPWLRGTFGAVDGDSFAYPEDEKIEGSESEVYRTLRYSVSRLRFTVPEGLYTLRVHFARPFHWKATGDSPEDRVEMEIEPDGPGRQSWEVSTPYRKASLFEKKHIRVEDGVLDLRFLFRSQVHVAATEVVQEEVTPGTVTGIPDWPSSPDAASQQASRY